MRKRTLPMAGIAVGVLAIAALACDAAVPAASPNGNAMTPTPSASSMDTGSTNGQLMGPGPRSGVDYMGREFEPAIGPIREDLLVAEGLESSGLVLKNASIQEGNNGDGHQVYIIPGLALEEGFLVRFQRSSSSYIHAPAIPSCQYGLAAFLYKAMDAAPPPLPFGPVTPSVPHTPVPTPSTPIISVELSAEGLLAAGWPRIDLERIEPKYNGVIYEFTNSGYINNSGADTSIPPEVLEEFELLEITYHVDLDLPTPLDGVFEDKAVTDRVRLLHFKNRPASELIVLDSCPEELGKAQFVFYQVSSGPDDSYMTLESAVPNQPSGSGPGLFPTPTAVPHIQ